MKNIMTYVAMLFVLGCSGNERPNISAFQAVYYAVNYESFKEEYPSLPHTRRDLIRLVKQSQGDELKDLMESKFVYPYGVMFPALESTHKKEAIEAATELLNFLEQQGLNIYKRDNAGCSSLHMAFVFEEFEMLQLLMERYDTSEFLGNPDSKVPLCRQDFDELYTRFLRERDHSD